MLTIIIKAAVKRFVRSSVMLLGKSAAGRYLYDQMINNAMGRTQEVTHRGLRLEFSIPDVHNKWRVDTFSTKEPETLEWIDGIPEGSTLWDVGANVGLYTCYAAKARGCQVFAFEPSVFNLELLARNIYLNGLTDQATVVPLPLSDELAINKLNMTTTGWGGALSTFGQGYGHDGKALRKVFEYRTVGLSMVDALEALRIPRPDYIKMDVDGIEHLILRGARDALQQVQGVLVEVNDEFAEQAQGCASCLERAGLTLMSKTHSQMVEDGAFKGAFNQIWLRIGSQSLSLNTNAAKQD